MARGSQDADPQGDGPREPPPEVGQQPDVGDAGHQQQGGQDRQRERPQDQREVLAQGQGQHDEGRPDDGRRPPAAGTERVMGAHAPGAVAQRHPADRPHGEVRPSEGQGQAARRDPRRLGREVHAGRVGRCEA